MIDVNSDEFFMREALKEAQRAFDKGEVPVGVVVVADNKIIARAHNLTQTLNDVTAHAEMQAITSAANAINGKYLNDCKMYITLEPCVMCAGALSWSQIGELIYGAADEKKGFTRYASNLLHPKTKIKAGVLENESRELMQRFFKKLRNT